MDDFAKAIRLLGSQYNFKNAATKRIALDLWDYKCTNESCNAEFKLFWGNRKTTGVYCPICRKKAELTQRTKETSGEQARDIKEKKEIRRRDQMKGQDGEKELSEKAKSMLEEMKK